MNQVDAMIFVTQRILGNIRKKKTDVLKAKELKVGKVVTGIQIGNTQFLHAYKGEVQANMVIPENGVIVRQGSSTKYVSN